jgi:hypothetical protein
MVFSDFQAYVAAYINRPLSSFMILPTSGVSILTQAINDAKRAAQREFDFKQQQARGFISTSAFGADLSLTTVDPTATPPSYVNVMYVISAWRYATIATGPTTYDYIRTQKYNFMVERDLRNIIPARMDALREPNTLPISYKQRVYVRGTTIYLTGIPNPITTGAPVNIWIDVMSWLPDYVNPTDTDFFITLYTDWFVIKVIQQLNFYLKEDQRIQISANIVLDKWNSVLAHQNRMNDGNDCGDNLD